jgi:hypothetical protein
MLASPRTCAQRSRIPSSQGGQILSRPLETRPRQKRTPNNAIGCAKFRSRSHDAVIRIYDESGNVIETYEHKGDFKEW